MRVAGNVEMLELEATLANGPGKINPLFVWDEKDAILFDAGLPNMSAAFTAAVQAAGIPYERLNKILITHSDIDHIGSLAQIIRESSWEISIFAHGEEKPYIECDLPPIRLNQMEESASHATGKRKEQITALTESLKRSYKMFKADVNDTVKDGEVLPFCGGITCIHTPGHTPGHMCYYLHQFNLLVAGDILQMTDGKLTRCPDFTVINKNAVEASLKKLCGLNIKAIVCYHGGLYQGDAQQLIGEIASACSYWGNQTRHGFILTNSPALTQDG